MKNKIMKSFENRIDTLWHRWNDELAVAEG